MLASIKSKLVIWFLSIFSVIFTVLGFFFYYEMKNIVIGSIDKHLHNEAQLIAGLLRVENENIEMELSEAEVGEYAVTLSGHYYQVVSGGRIIARSPSLSLSGASLPPSEESFAPYYRVIIGPEKASLRLMAQSFKLFNHTITIQVAESLEDSYHLLRSFRNIIIAVFPAVYLLSAAGIMAITGWSLSSLNLFSKKVGQITEMNLNERIDEKGMDKELKLLAAGFNTMMERLEDFFSKQSRFMSDASHELKTPTSVIKSYCDVTLRKERTTAEYQEAIQIIGEMVNRMSGIINRILEVSRLESKTFALNISDADLMDINEDVVKLLSHSASSRGITISLNGQKTNVRGDKERLTEMFINIVDNAIKYNKPGGLVDIEVGSREGWGVVTVADTGIGIPGEDKERIFDRFYRIDASRGVVAGSGLGLSIVKAIANAHSGKIEVESETGKGSRFIVSLPKNGKEQKHD